MSSWSNKPKALDSLSSPFKPFLKRAAIGMALGLGAGCATQHITAKVEASYASDIRMILFITNNPNNAKILGIRTATEELGISFTDFKKDYEFHVSHLEENRWAITYQKLKKYYGKNKWTIVYRGFNEKNIRITGIRAATAELGISFTEFRKGYKFEIKQLCNGEWQIRYWKKEVKPKKKRHTPDRQPVARQRIQAPERQVPQQTHERKTSAEIERENIIREVREAVFEQINHHRRKHDLQEVTRDPLAEKAAQMHAEDMLKSRVVAHWGSDGRLAHHRFSSVGGSDAVWENCSGQWWDGYRRNSKQELIRFAIESHDRMYNERPPQDGHRKNILDTKHTSVGIGFAFAPDGAYFMAQEFTDHYAEMSPVKRKAEVGETIKVSGRLVNNSTFFSVEVFWEPFPDPMSKAEREQTYSYHLPKNKKQLLPKLKGRRRYVDGGKGTVVVSGDKKRFETPVTFDRGPGIYMISVWADHPKFGNIQATHITIDVHEPKRGRTAKRFAIK